MRSANDNVPEGEFVETDDESRLRRMVANSLKRKKKANPLKPTPAEERTLRDMHRAQWEPKKLPGDDTGE